jgi:hypothetical protein
MRVEASSRVAPRGGHQTVGRKVGFANKAMWRVLKLETLVWAHMYDDTVHYAKRRRGGACRSRACSRRRSSRKIVFKLKRPIGRRRRARRGARRRRVARARLRDHRLRLPGLEVSAG